MVCPEIEPAAAATCDVPVVSAEAIPIAVMDATDVFDEAHATEEVRSGVLPSLKVPVAVNACCAPAGTVGLTGVTEIDTSAAAVTVSVAEPEIEPEEALMVVLPVPTLAALPVDEMVAMLVADEDQFTLVVMLLVLPLVYVPVAVN